MESLFEALYKYATEYRCGLLSPEDCEEQERCEIMVRCAIEELTAKGYGESARRVEDGLKALSWLGQRSLFRAGLSIGVELGRL